VSDIVTLQDILSGGADVAMVAFAFFLWKVDRRLLSVELQMKSMWKQYRIDKQGD